MNWDAIGAIAELLAAIGVILSLVYLAAQIKLGANQTEQNTKAVRASVYHELLGQIAAINADVVRFPDLAELIVRTRSGSEEPTEAERLRLRLMTTNSLRHQLYAFRMWEDGFISDEQWSELKSFLPRVMNSSVARQEWPRLRKQYPKAFQALVDEAVGGLTDTGAPASQGVEPDAE